MAVTSISKLLLRRSEERSERFYLVGCLCLAVFYATLLVAFAVADVPVDQAFFARRSAVRLRIAREHPVEIGKPVAATSDHVALLDGWSSPESWGIWSDGPLASFAIRLPPGERRRTLIALACAVMLDREASQEVTADVNGREVGHWSLTKSDAVIVVAAPDDVIPASRIAIISLHIRHPTVSPDSRDPRALGLGLKSVTVLGDSPPE